MFDTRLTVLTILLLAASLLPAAESLRVMRGEGTVEIDNGLVKGRFTRDAEGVKQEYFASRENQWVLLAEGYRSTNQSSFASRYDTSADPAHRFVVTSALQSIGRVEENPDSVRVVLEGKSSGTVIAQTVELRRGQRYLHIEVKASLDGTPPQLDYLLLPLMATIDGKPDAVHAPTYKPTADSVIGDRIFFAPALYVQKDERFVALLPDVDIINANVVFAKDARQHPDTNAFPVPVDPTRVSMPTALDLELPSAPTQQPILAYGMMDTIVHQHVWFQHTVSPGSMVRELSRSEVRIGADLLLSSNEPSHRGYQLAARHLWERYGSGHFHQPKPQAMPNAEYARVCFPANLEYQGYDVAGQQLSHRHLPDRPDMRAWQQWEVDGFKVGGLRLYAPQWFHLIANLGWWNNACDAAGFYYWGTQLHDDDLLDKARRMVNLTLSAPQNQGLFPAVYDLQGKRWLRSLWNPPLKDYDPSHAAAYWDWNSGGAYQTAAASVTAGYLLQYRRNCEDDPRIVPYVRRYGDFLLANMPSNGCVPGWFTEDLKPLPGMKWNADGGAHAWVLSELYLATGEQKYLDGARKAAGFLLDEVLPRQRWCDFEAFYSCAIKPETFFDQRTDQGPCNTMAMSWALQGFLSLHEATQDQRYLEGAEATADFAAMFQAVWAPHYVVTAYPFGGMSSQLGDSEWLDQRAHRFAEPFVRIGLLAARQDLVERGIAAARSSLTLANHPRHQSNGIYTHTDFPVGLGPENVDHEGFPQRPLSSGPSWNSIGGMTGIAHVMRRLGGAYIDVAKHLAVGVDGVDIVSVQRQDETLHIKLKNQLAALAAPYSDPYSIELRIAGLPAGKHTLRINDQPQQQVESDGSTTCTVRVNVSGPDSKEWISPSTPPVAQASCAGTRYEALVPDTLDLAEMAKLAIHGLTGPLDPADDYSLYWIVGYRNNPPVMRKEDYPHLQTKFMEALPLMRLMTGSNLNEQVDRTWMDCLAKSLGPDGLVYRSRKPGEPWTALPILGQGRSISVMTLRWLRDKDPVWKERIERAIGRLRELVVERGDAAAFNMENFPLGYIAQPSLPELKTVQANEITARLIQPLGHYYAATGYAPAKELGDKLVRSILAHSQYWGPEGEWLKDQLDPAQYPGREADIHTGLHSHVLLYMADYAARTKNADLLNYCRKSYAWAKRHNSELPGQCETATRIGFWVEYQNPYYPTAETCGVADMIAVAIMLSRSHAEDCWDDADRWLRNHFAECQMRSADWVSRLQSGSWPRKAEANETIDSVAQRNVGAFFGWPSANDGCPSGGGHMHCCTGNASRTLYYVWESMLECTDGKLRVNLLLNRASRWADIDSHIPYSGQVDVRVKQPLAEVILRVPEWIATGSPQISAARGDSPISVVWQGRYVSLGAAQQGDVLRLNFPLGERTITRRVYGAPVETVIGGVVYQSLTFRGNEVVEIDPPGQHYPFYQRSHLRGETRYRKVNRFVADETIAW